MHKDKSPGASFNVEASAEEKYRYTGLFLDDESRDKLISVVGQLTEIPDTWTIVAHHMTTRHFTQEAEDVEQFNKLHFGEQFDIFATSLGISDKAIAVGVDTEVPSAKERKHITIAIADGAQSMDSDIIEDWRPIQPILLHTTLSGILLPDPSAKGDMDA